LFVCLFVSIAIIDYRFIDFRLADFLTKATHHDSSNGFFKAVASIGLMFLKNHLDKKVEEEEDEEEEQNCADFACLYTPT